MDKDDAVERWKKLADQLDAVKKAMEVARAKAERRVPDTSVGKTSPHDNS